MGRRAWNYTIPALHFDSVHEGEGGAEEHDFDEHELRRGGNESEEGRAEASPVSGAEGLHKDQQSHEASDERGHGGNPEVERDWQAAIPVGEAQDPRIAGNRWRRGRASRGGRRSGSGSVGVISSFPW